MAGVTAEPVSQGDRALAHPVTARRTGGVTRSPSRNDPVDGWVKLLGELSRQNRELDARVPDRVVRRERIRQAERGADVCAECGRELPPGEPISRFPYRELGHTVNGPDWHTVTLAATCLECAKVKARIGGLNLNATVTCERCGRVIVCADWEPERYTRPVCSAECRNAIRRTDRKMSRELHKVECQECGELFSPKRSDAVWCSNACRQRAYRKRKAA